MLEGRNLRWDRAQHCLTEGSLRSPVPVLADFWPLTASSPPKQHRGGGRSAVPGGRTLPSYSKESFRFP